MPGLPPVIDPQQKQSKLTGIWSPGLLGMVNDTAVKLARIRGEFVWHTHENEDEMFLVVEGKLRMEFREGHRDLHAGQLIIVPRGMEHRPVAADDCLILLIEPSSTINTGDADSSLRQDELKLI